MPPGPCNLSSLRARHPGLTDGVPGRSATVFPSGACNLSGGALVWPCVRRDSEARVDEAAGATRLPCRDSARMGRVLLRLEPRLTAVARRLFHDPDTAADVVQNAFEKVLRHCDQFPGSTRPSTWMHRIVVNEALMWMRRETRRAATRIDPDDWGLVFPRSDGPEEAALASEEQNRLEQALARLPAQERSLLVESALEGRAYAALARELGLSAGAVRSRALRARRRLAAELEWARGAETGTRRSADDRAVDPRRNTQRGWMPRARDGSRGLECRFPPPDTR